MKSTFYFPFVAAFHSRSCITRSTEPLSREPCWFQYSWRALLMMGRSLESISHGTSPRYVCRACSRVRLVEPDNSSLRIRQVLDTKLFGSLSTVVDSTMLCIPLKDATICIKSYDESVFHSRHFHHSIIGRSAYFSPSESNRTKTQCSFFARSITLKNS